MKSNKLLLLIIFIISLLFFNSISTKTAVTNISADTPSNQNYTLPIMKNLIDHSPMTIDDEGDFIYHSLYFSS